MTTQPIQQTFLDELGLGDLPQEKQEAILVKMTEVILKRIFLETVEKLSDTDKEDYAQMIESQSEPDQIENFLKEKIPNYEEMVKEIVENFKKEMKEEN